MYQNYALERPQLLPVEKRMLLCRGSYTPSETNVHIGSSSLHASGGRVKRIVEQKSCMLMGLHTSGLSTNGLIIASVFVNGEASALQRQRV